LSYLILSPPVHQPSEPPSGAFLLSSALAARGIEAPFFDLSLEFFHYALEKSGVNTAPAIRYMTAPPGGAYTAHQHASHSGVIMAALKRYIGGFPGWRLTPMDCVPPGGLHRPGKLPVTNTPFTGFYEEILGPMLNRFSTETVLVSVAYLSQLPAAVELSRFLKRAGRKHICGGSLPESLSRTGTGLSLLKESLRSVSTGDGSELFPSTPNGVLDQLAYPELLSERVYLSPAPVLPLTFTIGCIWNRCLFCPDREKPLRQVPASAAERMIEEAPRGSMIHFIDSTMPVERVSGILPVLRDRNARFFGFARATGEFLGEGLLNAWADAGCAMLQWGLESGSQDILKRFGKGINLETAKRVLKESAALGIRNYVYLLFGLPGESWADRKMTLELVRSSGADMDFLNTSVFNLPVDCELSRNHRDFRMELGAYDEGEDVIRLYRPFTCCGANPREEAKAFLRNTFDTDPAAAVLAAATPRWFRAAHMAFMKRRRGDE